MYNNIYIYIYIHDIICLQHFETSKAWKLYIQKEDLIESNKMISLNNFL